jgi:hypothetical protein
MKRKLRGNKLSSVKLFYELVDESRLNKLREEYLDV